MHNLELFKKLVNEEKINIDKVHALISRISSSYHSSNKEAKLVQQQDRSLMSQWEVVFNFMQSNPKVLLNMLRPYLPTNSSDSTKVNQYVDSDRKNKSAVCLYN